MHNEIITVHAARIILQEGEEPAKPITRNESVQTGDRLRFTSHSTQNKTQVYSDGWMAA